MQVMLQMTLWATTITHACGVDEWPDQEFPQHTLWCRFDLMHVMIDDPDDIMDYRIASHIVAVHQRQDQAFDVPYTMADIQLYLKYARAHKPELTAAVSCPSF